jgi:hypothetical protein
MDVAGSTCSRSPRRRRWYLLDLSWATAQFDLTLVYAARRLTRHDDDHDSTRQHDLSPSNAHPEEFLT